jgi:CheY-like chemotaxis protein
MAVDRDESSPSNPLVLVVDDNPDIRLALEITLQQAGLQTCSVGDGEAALRTMSRVRPDVVLLDLMMPLLDGWGVLERLRGWPDAPPVIVLSASLPPEGLERTYAMGAAGYMTKPFSTAELVDRIREALGFSRLATEPPPAGVP